MFCYAVFFQTFGNPDLNDGLTRDAQTLCLFVE